MNEKIKQFAEEAAKKHGHTIKFSPEITETLDSFAELIIKECANVAADHEALDIYEEIREHFGVENE